jgi:signal peptidase II
MTTFQKLRFLVLFFLLAMTVGCDQTSKHLARLTLSYDTPVELPGGLGELRLADNPGSFLSLGATLPASLRLAFLTLGVAFALVAVFVYLVRNPAPGWLSFLGLTLLCAGGSSNLIDRITRHGLVTDFLFLRLGPLHTGIFNFADCMIVAGFLALVCSTWRQSNQKNAE